jgi:acyl dehydratase
MPETSFYEALGADRYAATRATESPWDRRLQHGSPPTALMVHAIERAHPRADVRVARVNAEFLGPIPRDVMRVRTSVTRPGKRIEMLEAALEDERSGRDVAVARVWRIAVKSDAELAQRAALDTEPAPLPTTPVHALFGIPPGEWGYADAIEWRFVFGGTDRSGPAGVWTCPHIPLVGDGPLTPLDRILLVADSANGISGVLPFDEWLFVPPTLSIALQRHTAGEWVRLDAQTTLGPDGHGVTTLTLADRSGYLGSGTQALFIERRT